MRASTSARYVPALGTCCARLAHAAVLAVPGNARRCGALVAALVSLAAPPLHAQEAPFASFADAIRNRIEGGRAVGRIVAGAEPVLATGALPRFYDARGYHSAWFEGDRPIPAVAELLRELEGAGADGLDPMDYHLDRLHELLGLGSPAGVDDLAGRVDAELLLSDAFLVYGSHLLQGRVNPETIEPEWLANRRGADLGALLAEALGGRGVSTVLQELRPDAPGYAGLKDALARLRQVEADGGWPAITEGPTLHPGDRDPRVADLRRRLDLAGDLEAGGPAENGGDTALYDSALERAVRRFQERHGLEPDGAVGGQTLAALNTPVEQRIDQIEINLERWRWLPQDLGRRHLRVNIAGFDVQVREDGEMALRMRAVVGRSYRQTPSFTGRMTYLVLAPYWHVPPSIAINDKLPLILEDRGYLARQQMSLLNVATNEPVDPAAVDWSGIDRTNFNSRFRIRQDPGFLNALGNVKFMFPNSYNVYLHDTPSRELFAVAERSFSSGCIRLEHPLELAEYLLAGDAAWDRERIDRVIARGVETSVVLSDPVPVHILYWTAWVEPDGTLEFRRDLYERDGRVRAALLADPPAPS